MERQRLYERGVTDPDAPQDLLQIRAALAERLNKVPRYSDSDVRLARTGARGFDRSGDTTIWCISVCTPTPPGLGPKRWVIHNREVHGEVRALFICEAGRCTFVIPKVRAFETSHTEAVSALCKLLELPQLTAF